MLERVGFSKPLSKEERPKLTNKSFWWNNKSLEEINNEKNNEIVVDNSNDAFLMSESFENYMKTESKDIAKLHDKLHKLRKQLYSDLNESQTEDNVNESTNLNDKTINSSESGDNETSTSDDSEIIITKTIPGRSNASKLNSKQSGKLPFSKTINNSIKNRENNFTIDSLDAKAKNLIDRR